MPRLATCLQVQFALALSYGVIATPLSVYSQQQTLQDSSQAQAHAYLESRKLHGRFLHITDFHPDEFYKPHTSTEDGIACHRGKGMAGTFGAEKTDCDSPFSLVDATLKWIEENVKDTIDFVVWTGDSARHDSDEEHPRTDKTVLDSNREVAKKMIKTFSSPNGRLEVPIIPTFGNNDFLPHNIMYPGPNRWFASYADIWSRFIPEEQRHSFEFGGWFHVDVIPGKLSVFSLNTMFFFDRNAAVDGCAQPSEPGYKHMEWLRIQLDLMRQNGIKAILIGHVPPARTSSKQNWDETCWQRYTLWLQKYRDVVVASLYGHMNIDHFLLSDTKQIELGLGAAAQAEVQRQSINESNFSVQGKEDYLQELRDGWGNLPDSAIKLLDELENEEQDSVSAEKKHKMKKKGKFKKIGGAYAERYQLALVSPSIVPNYFPTMRAYEYNMTGLEDSRVWEDDWNNLENGASGIDVTRSEDSGGDDSMELRSIEMEKKRKGKGRGKGRKGRKGRGKPKDPKLIIPAEPPKGSLPGPAYYPQQFTLLGYTQYFANLTHINNDDADVDDDAHGAKWRDGKHGDKKPKHSPARPRKFHFEVEYSTFDEKRFKLKDLTVRNYLHLAYRLGRRSKINSEGLEDADFDDVDAVDDAEEASYDGAASDDVDANKGKKNRKKRHEKNKTWLRWLSYAFVQTIPEDELKKM